jgi:PAS domain S-box-containing protein
VVAGGRAQIEDDKEGAMNSPVLILYLEDDARDAELVRDKLQRIAMPHELRVAKDRTEYEAALAQTRFDLILSDYSLPNYDGMAALALARVKQPHVPFILISGTLGEERAVDCMLGGATDFVLKQRLNRLVPTILRALTEAEAHQKRRAVEAALRESEALLSSTFQTLPIPISVTDLATEKWVEINEAFLNVTGYTRAEVIGHTYREIKLWKRLEDREKMGTLLGAQGYARDLEVDITKKSGATGTILISAKECKLAGKPHLLIVGIEITERKQADEAIRSQLEELRRWQTVTLGREGRIDELKREVNALATRLGEKRRYESAK